MKIISSSASSPQTDKQTLVTGRFGPTCSVQAEYGNVVKWPSAISDGIRAQQLVSQGEAPVLQHSYRLPFLCHLKSSHMHQCVCVCQLRRSLEMHFSPGSTLRLALVSLCTFVLDAALESAPTRLAAILIGCALLTEHISQTGSFVSSRGLVEAFPQRFFPVLLISTLKKP